MAFLAYVAILLVSISGILLRAQLANPAETGSQARCARDERAAFRRGPARRRQSGSANCRTNGPGPSETSRRAASDCDERRGPEGGNRCRRGGSADAAGAPAGGRANKRRRSAAGRCRAAASNRQRLGGGKGQRNGEAPVRRRRLRRRLHFVPGIGLHLSALRRPAARLRRAALRTATLGRARAAAGSFAARPRRALCRSQRRLARAAALERFGNWMSTTATALTERRARRAA